MSWADCCWGELGERFCWGLVFSDCADSDGPMPIILPTVVKVLGRVEIGLFPRFWGLLELLYGLRLLLSERGFLGAPFAAPKDNALKGDAPSYYY